ncbi:MAG: DUF6468 domain-containing protein [Rhodospirillales bacterium]
MTLALALDIVLAVLLAATIWCAVSLNRRLGALRRDRSELASLAGDFAAATERAGDSVGLLAENAEDLQSRTEQARSVADDLAFLMDRGEKTADKLEKLVRIQKSVTGVETADADEDRAPPPTPAKAKRKKTATAEKARLGPELRAERGDDLDAPARPAPRGSDAERELLEALRASVG